MIDQLTLSPAALANLMREPVLSLPGEDDAGRVRRNPLDGRPVHADNVDELVDALEQAEQAGRALQAWRDELKGSLAALCDGEARTQRLRGGRRAVRIVAPPPKLDYSILREAWNSFPRLRDDFLRIERLSVKTREFKKAVSTNGPADFTSCIAMIRSAIRKSSALPSVVIES